MIKTLILILSITTLLGCASSKNKYGESGVVWCNDPFLRELKKPFGDSVLHVANEGYIYALAGALVLQGESDEDKDHYFLAPERLKKVHQYPRHKSGFEAATFELKNKQNNQIEEVIIAFTGSNDKADWLFTNLLFSKTQYKLAREYTKDIAVKYPSLPLTVTGYSLGGGLAVHVTKNPETSDLINKTWAFNPSPKTYANGNIDNRIWLAAVRGEALAISRKPIWKIWPGVAAIGAPQDQTAEDFYLIRSNPIYGHFRWVLARNMLHAADLHIYNTTGNSTTEPLEILKNSSFVACEKADKYVVNAGH